MNPRPTLADRCRIHADKMSGEGWYVTAGVLWDAAEALDKLGYEIACNLPDFKDATRDKPPVEVVRLELFKANREPK